jgi:hemolysin III
MSINSKSVKPTAGKITEEVLNSSVHGLGAIAGIIGLIIGITTISGSMSLKIGFIVYGICLVLLMTMSCLYHALYFSRAKPVFQKLDRSSIMVLIAGSYTPFILYLFEGWLQIFMIALVWAIAIFGVVLQTTMPKLSKKYGSALYIGFGWLALLFIPRFSQLTGIIIVLLISGGILYTVGAGIMAINKPFTHVGWHVMVVLAAVAHYFAVILLV